MAVRYKIFLASRVFASRLAVVYVLLVMKICNKIRNTELFSSLIFAFIFVSKLDNVLLINRGIRSFECLCLEDFIPNLVEMFAPRFFDEYMQKIS